jgi:hypothetical protein
LRKLGIDVAKSTVEKYRVRSRKPPFTGARICRWEWIVPSCDRCSHQTSGR